MPIPQNREPTRPCPFCGGRRMIPRDVVNGWQIMCVECITKGPLKDSEAEAWASWQQRYAHHRLEVASPALSIPS